MATMTGQTVAAKRSEDEEECRGRDTRDEVGGTPRSSIFPLLGRGLGSVRRILSLESESGTQESVRPKSTLKGSVAEEKYQLLEKSACHSKRVSMKSEGTGMRDQCTGLDREGLRFSLSAAGVPTGKGYLEEEDGGRKISRVINEEVEDHFLEHEELIRQSVENKMKKIVKIQSLLMQFSRDLVRKDLLAGKMNLPVDEGRLLQQLDTLRWRLLPQWEKDDDVASRVAAEELAALAEERNQPYHLGDDDTTKTFRSWAQILRLVATSPYWDDVPYSERCVHFSPQKLEVTGSPAATLERATYLDTAFNKPGKCKDTRLSSNGDNWGRGGSNPRKLATRSTVRTKNGARYTFGEVEESDDEVPRELGEPARSCHPVTSAINRRKMVEVITVSDSDEETESEEEPGERQVNYSYYAGKVVKPEVYSVNGQQSVKDYLIEFNSYFDRKYQNGSSKERTRLLGTFLEGEIKDVYGRICATSYQFSYVRDELLQWYRDQKVGGRSFWRRELQRAHLEEGEKLYLYGMRLLNMAQHCYNDDRECAREVREHFLRTVSGSFAREVRTIERHARVGRTGEPHKLSWKALMSLARDTDSTSCPEMIPGNSSAKHTPEVFFAAAGEKKNNQSSKEEKGRKLEYIPRSSSSFPGGDREGSKFCMWCGRRGHASDTCRMNVVCFNCNQRGHISTYCPENQPPLQCPSCQGNHLGKDCHSTREKLN